MSSVCRSIRYGVTRARGRKIVLATAADRSIADAIAGHLDLFDAVHASDGERNLKATDKRDLLRENYGDSGFDYIGDSSADRVVLVELRPVMQRHVPATEIDHARAGGAMNRIQRGLARGCCGQRRLQATMGGGAKVSAPIAP